ncbi:cellulase family glycosylhydrolase [Bacteroides zhangwenhongii]|jgi:endoglucanase|uniref:cellulase family glycosylhydrolase n=1 Tax=Bacteroides zhangwenhongii TaxID=2650157 RepID=UPI0022E02846|nr:cellulase family glycosylhydrolase [Bacteroides zhangwenhongii]
MKHNIIILTILSVVTYFFAACTDDTRDLFLEAPHIEEPSAFTPADLSALHVEGRYLKNTAGEIVNLHGFAQTFSPYFNNSAWSNYDVDACLNYNQKCFDGVLAAGWKVNFVRQHMDPYWSSPGAPDEAHAYAYYDKDRFLKYLNLVFIPMAEYAIERGCYVVMRPPGVSPETIAVDDKYNEYLIDIWNIVSSHPKIKNNPGIMFELANEPVNIVGTDGVTGASTDSQFEALKLFLQPIVDVIRENGCNNVLWLPGLGYQSLYGGCAKYKVEGSNIGYAVHCYCGWYGSDAEADSGEGIGTSTGGGYKTFQQGWDNQVKPISDIAPIMVTEMDWALSKYNSSWGKGITGTAGAEGFGANFKYITDNSGNVSWLLFTGQELLMQFKDEPGVEGEYTFLNDPEACPWPIFHWFEEYAAGDAVDHGALTNLLVKDVIGGELSLASGAERYLLVQATFSDGTTDLVTAKCEYASSNSNIVRIENGRLTTLCDGEANVVITYMYKEVVKSVTVRVISSSFPLDGVDSSIFGDGTYNKITHTLITGPSGFGGWQYNNGLDLSASNYLVVELCQGTNVNGSSSFRLFGTNSYWTEPAMYSVNDYRLVIDLKNMVSKDGSVDPSQLYIIGFWTNGGKENAVVLNRVYVADEKPTDNYIPPVAPEDPDDPTPEPNPDDPSIEDLVFPLEDLNPNIFKGEKDAPGTFDLTTHKLLTAVCGFGGWSLENTETSWDLSKYRYLVVKLGEGSEYTMNGWSFRLFDNGYWGGQVEILMAENVEDNRLKVDLTKTWMTVGGNSRRLDMTKINILGFWSFGDPYPLYIERVYATNEAD